MKRPNPSNTHRAHSEVDSTSNEKTSSSEQTAGAVPIHRRRAQSVVDKTLSTLQARLHKRITMASEEEIQDILDMLESARDESDLGKLTAVSSAGTSRVDLKILHAQAEAISDLKQRAEVSEEALRKADESIKTLQGQLQLLSETWLSISAEERRSYEEELGRLRAATLSPTLDHSPFLQSTAGWKVQLARAGLFFTEEVIQQCVRALRRGQILLLSGPSGSGKSTLARALAALAFGHSVPQGASLCSEASAQQHWLAVDVIAGEKILAGHSLPDLGCFLRALVEVQNDGRRWLVIDEINSANVFEVFKDLEPIIRDGMSAHSSFIHPDVKLDGKPIEFPIPKTFRIIGTMNTRDVRRFPLSPWFLKGASLVEIELPDRDLELEIARSILRSELPKRGKPARNESRLLEEALTFMRRLREIGFEIGHAGCILGPYFTARLCLRSMEFQGDLDKAVNLEILPGMDHVTSLQKDRLLRDLFTDAQFPTTRRSMMLGLEA